MDWNAIVCEVGPPLFRFFCLRNDEALAADLVQDTLIRLHRKVNEGRYDSKRGTLRAFTFGIAFHVQRENNRRLRSVREISMDSMEIAVETSGDRLNSISLRKALLKLSPDEQDILGLLLDKELTLEEIADVTRMPIGTVKSHVYRAKQKLKEILRRDDHE